MRARGSTIHCRSRMLAPSSWLSVGSAVPTVLSIITMARAKHLVSSAMTFLACVVTETNRSRLSFFERIPQPANAAVAGDVRCSRGGGRAGSRRIHEQRHDPDHGLNASNVSTKSR